MKRILVFAIILAMSVTLLASCKDEGDGTPSGMKLASDLEISDYYLYVPKGWTVDMSTGITSAYVSSVDKSNVSVSYGVPSENNLEEFWTNNKSHYESIFEEFTVLEEGGIAKLGEYDAARYNYTAKYEGKEYQFLQYMTIKGAYVYIFTYTAENEENSILGYVPYEKNLEQVLTIISEFKFQ